VSKETIKIEIPFDVARGISEGDINSNRSLEVLSACNKALSANREYVVSVHENWGAGDRVSSFTLTGAQMQAQIDDPNNIRTLLLHSLNLAFRKALEQ
jgi:hypothetical protein